MLYTRPRSEGSRARLPTLVSSAQDLELQYRLTICPALFNGVFARAAWDIGP